MGFENLDVWKRSCRLSCDVYKAMENCRDYGFKDQITRSGLSIPSNIAEGFERGSVKEKQQFYYYARGSAGELKTQVYIGQKIGYISPEDGYHWRDELSDIQKMLTGLIRKTG
ncbi:four helix bundle protein [Amphritea sp. 2_MG-2023]|uniref:four helix bundle protein n=1 Tax=Amphritea TaxID=515417 RepID=UPI001C066653|nr:MULTISPECIES: four helix bundle protein [Amphritea]MBU2964343.1 four helix bundle protein [Amphritea atlantica]MDO6419697.1 four helix bundle protein [Amphritea sp. 2_MG-2023]